MVLARFLLAQAFRILLGPPNGAVLGARETHVDSYLDRLILRRTK